MKKIIVLIVIIGILALITIGVNKESRNDSAKERNLKSEGIAKKPELLSSIEWLKRYPQLKNVPTNSQTAVIDKLRVSESISELIGPIDNPYGVRNDILAAILEVVPESNPRMLRAAIKTAYYDNLLFYSLTDEQKLQYVKYSSLADYCVSYYDKTDNLDIYDNFAQMEERSMRNTAARLNYTRQIETTTFAWKPLGTGLGGNTEEERCQNEEY